MKENLHILVCSTYLKECEGVLKAEGWNNVVFHAFSQACIHPNYKKLACEQISQAAKEYARQDLVVCQCFSAPSAVQSGLDETQLRHLDQCLYMLANRNLVDHLMKQGAYLLTPGWLEGWQAHLKKWGFDQITGKTFFQECTRKFVLLDTGLNPESERLLQEMGDYLEMPYEVVPVGIDHLQFYLFRIVSEWQQKKGRTQHETLLAEANRNSADYAMAFDLLTNLTQIKNEAEAIETILELFTILFSPGSISYCPVQGDEFGNQIECQQDEEWRELSTRWNQDNREDYIWTASGAGFFLRFQYKSETLGILKIEDIQLPQYKQQYLNLALSIAHLCGLALSNARTFQRLKEAEAVALWEKEISETLRKILSELTLQLDLDVLLEHILKSLSRVTPFSDAAVSLLVGDQLKFVAGHRISQDGKSIEFPMPEQPLSLDSQSLRDMEALIQYLDANATIQNYLKKESLQSWMNVPLMLRGVLLGFLSMGNHYANVYNESEMKLAQSFADEVSIAIENARLFKEIQTLAITDSLTGLYNRRHFYHMANLEFVRSDRYDRPLSLLLIDVDFFKSVNDVYGHLVGDLVLKNIAQNCLLRVRSGDLVGRYGGEEFTMLLPETDCEHAIALAERMRQKIEDAVLMTDQGLVKVTISIGVASKDAGCKNLEELLRRSDDAMYAAKNVGRNCVRVWMKTSP